MHREGIGGDKQGQWEGMGDGKKCSGGGQGASKKCSGKVCGRGSQYSITVYNMQWEGIRGDEVKLQREGRGREKKMRSRRGWGTGSKYSVKGLHAVGGGEGVG